MIYLTKYVFQIKHMITGINESKTLTKHIPCECKCKFDAIKCKSSQWWNNNKCRFEFKRNWFMSKRICLESVNSCICENGKYVASIMDDSAIIWDEVLKSYDEEIYSNKFEWIKYNL